MFDLEPPALACPDLTVVCTEDLQASKPALAAGLHVGDLAGYSANYANIVVLQPPSDAVTPNYPTVWPISVTDNVNADIAFDGEGDRTGVNSRPTYARTTTTVHTPEGHVESAWIAATGYEEHASISGAVVTGLPTTEVAAAGTNRIWQSIPGGGDQ